AGATASAAGEGRGGATGAVAGSGTVAADARGGGAAATAPARPARSSTCTLGLWSATIPSGSPRPVSFLVLVDSSFSPHSCCVSRAPSVPLPCRRSVSPCSPLTCSTSSCPPIVPLCVSRPVVRLPPCLSSCHLPCFVRVGHSFDCTSVVCLGTCCYVMLSFAFTIVLDLLVSLLPRRPAPALLCLQVPSANGICDGDVAHVDSAAASVCHRKVRDLFLNGAVCRGLAMDDEPYVLGHANESIPQLAVGVDTVLARAATEKVVREAGVWDSGMVRAVAVFRRGERKGQPEAHGIGEVNGPYPPVRRNGDGCQPVPGPVTGQRKHPLRVSAQGVQLHMPYLLNLHGVSAPVHLESYCML
ncbi:unnamed protein product, partial [Closterium sp. NIES-54]